MTVKRSLNKLYPSDSAFSSPPDTPGASPLRHCTLGFLFQMDGIDTSVSVFEQMCWNGE